MQGAFWREQESRVGRDGGGGGEAWGAEGQGRRERGAGGRYRQEGAAPGYSTAPSLGMPLSLLLSGERDRNLTGGRKHSGRAWGYSVGLSPSKTPLSPWDPQPSCCVNRG